MDDRNQIKLKIEAMEQMMFANEMADNFYYISGRRAVDLRRLDQLKKELKKYD